MHIPKRRFNSLLMTGKWRRMVDVAVKTLKQNSMTAADFLEEAKTMHRLRHPKLVQLMGVCTREEPMYIITELMINGALLEFLHKDQGSTLTLKKLLDMMAQVIFTIVPSNGQAL